MIVDGFQGIILKIGGLKSKMLWKVATISSPSQYYTFVSMYIYINTLSIPASFCFFFSEAYYL